MIEAAPDGSSIEPLTRTPHASQCLCTLAPGQITKPVQHRTIHELWYVLEGQGELWLDGDVLELAPGNDAHLQPGQPFQFRCTGTRLSILITSIPAWPGDEEAQPAPNGPWQPAL